jgi:hypothetical protein
VTLRRSVRVGALALTFLALLAQPAAATFHEVMVREVYPGSAAQPGSEYVELQMWSPGQNLVADHMVSFYGPSGAQVGSASFPTDVSGGANQSTLLVATPAAEAEFGVVADAPLAPGLLDPAGGAICWETLDCVAWGNFSGPAKSPVGSPATAAGIPDGMALRRTIAPGCATLLEPADDSDDSATDFAAVFPAPRPNSVKPAEHACESSSGGSGAIPGSRSPAGGQAPQTALQRRPPRRTHDRTPTFRFASNEDDARFECRLDRTRFKPCRSPYTTPRLRLGRHTFQVRARDSSGRTDPSPASYGFRVLGKK